MSTHPDRHPRQHDDRFQRRQRGLANNFGSLLPTSASEALLSGIAHEYRRRWARGCSFGRQLREFPELPVPSDDFCSSTLPAGSTVGQYILHYPLKFGGGSTLEFGTCDAGGIGVGKSVSVSFALMGLGQVGAPPEPSAVSNRRWAGARERPGSFAGVGPSSCVDCE